MEAPYLQKVYQQYKTHGANVIGVAVDGDEVASLKQFRTQHKVNYPITLDTGNRVFGHFNLSFPAIILIDRKGVIRLIEEGFEPKKFAATQGHFAVLLPPSGTVSGRKAQPPRHRRRVKH